MREMGMDDGRMARDMRRVVEQTLLYDFYGELLTEHQKNIYEDVVLNDLSLSEIAQNYGISRQAVSDLMRRIGKLLMGYESKLHLVAKFENAKGKIRLIRESAQGIQSDLQDGSCDSETLLKQVENIADISQSILDDF